MKNTIYILFIMQLILSACSQDSQNESDSFETFLDKWNLRSNLNEEKCTSVSDSVKYPDPFTKEIAETFAIPDEIIHNMSTCGLLETLLDCPPRRMLGPWCTTCSNSNLPGITMFNEELLNIKEAVEFFKRYDCFSVLSYKYLTIIKEKKEQSGQIAYFEMVLASDICMSVLNESEKIQLIAMALEKVKNKNSIIHIVETCHIMIAVMKACDYSPFMNEVSANIVEGTFGYNIGDYDIQKYAKDFLNEMNK